MTKTISLENISFLKVPSLLLVIMGQKIITIIKFLDFLKVLKICHFV